MKTSRFIISIAFFCLLFSCSEEKSVIDKISPLYQVKAKVKPGDWLDEHKEIYYDFDTYKATKPVRPDSTRGIIYIYKLGENTQAEDSLLTITCDYLQRFFHLKTKIAQTFPINCVPDSMKRTNADGAFQICTLFMLDTLIKLPIPKDAVVSICFTKYDLYPSPEWNYVFGQAYLKNRAGIWSFNRYGNVNDPKEFKQALIRTLKVAAHETGHMFSITHCVRYECTMNGSNSLNEMDAATLHLCPDCLEKLSWNIGFDPLQYFKDLESFYKKHGLTEDAEFMNKNIRVLEE